MTQDKAIQRAREIAIAQGWPWEEPLWVKRHKPNLLDRLFGRPITTWTIRSNTNFRGRNVTIILNDESGECLGKWFAPR